MFRLKNLLLPWQAQVCWAVNAATLQTYDSSTIREDLSDAENMISPTDTPFTSRIAGSKSVDNTKHEWLVVELASASGSNRVPEGEDAPGVDTAITGLRRSNYTQISDKLVKVSDTSQRVNGAADIEKMSKQIAYKLKELKRDKEKMILDNVAAVPGAADGATTRQAAGLPAFIITNGTRLGTGTPGAAPTLSGTTQGYPNAAATDCSNTTALTEDMLNNMITSVWTQGAEPRYVMLSPTNKRLISKTFTGNATKYKDADDKKLISAVDVYESDFGQVQIVPNRFQRGRDVFVLDPEFVKIVVLQPTRQLDVARTGHAVNKLIQSEYGLEVSNEKAIGVIADTTG